MRKIIEIPVNDVTPNRDEVMKTQWGNPAKEPSEILGRFLDRAMELFIEFSDPIGVISEISIPEFEVVYQGEGLNEEKTPLGHIFRRADSLALFALTIGETVSRKIDGLFKSNEFVMGSMLDSIASAGLDKAGDILVGHFSNWLSGKEKIDSSIGILRYSPGYCGWHLSGQKKIFEFLHPEHIGIELLDSFMMKPLKSISGVIVAGKREIHKFKDSYPFCRQCKTHSCRDRIRGLFKNTP